MLRLVINNDDRHAYLRSLLRAVMWDSGMARMPDDLARLILDIDLATIEDDLALALKLAS